ncbi:MAG: hypothetical protein IPK83_16015 [Planctomycetes bacterium]|nr:hypothetical protein [Planctomycetota bacterium]
MSLGFGAHCDDFHIATRLFLKLNLALERETVLHFFDSIRREFPNMKKLRRRDDASIILEEDEDERGQRRWLRLDESTVRLGHHNPPTQDDSQRFADTVLKMAPYHLTLGDLDYDHIEVVFGFDLEYRGNHDQLIADTFFSNGPLAGLLNHSSIAHTIDMQPFLGVALSENCDTQAYVEIKSRTSTFEVRTGQFETQPLSVFLTVRRFFGLSEGESLLGVHRELTEIGADWAAERVVPMVIQPLAQAIASRP